MMAGADYQTGGAAGGGRGRDAVGPAGIPGRGWRDVVLRVKDRLSKDAITLVAAGVSFYAFLAVFPAITALISIYGMVADPAQISQQMSSLKGTVPSSTLQLVQKQMSAVAQGPNSSLGIGLIVSVLIALYSASKGVGALITSLNIAYGEDEKRGFIKLKLITLLYTFTAILFVILMLAVIGVPGYLQHIGLPAWLTVAIRVLRWAVMFALMVAALSVLYAYGPSRARARMRWVRPGAILATVVWLIASIGFSFYISNFGSYNKTYGALAAIVVLMMWFWISALVILVGAELNGESEAQTRVDSTTGAPEALGERGASAADEIRASP